MIFRTTLEAAFEYRGTLVIWFLAELVSIVTWLFLWSAVYREQFLVGNYEFYQIVLYFLLIPVVGALTSINLSDNLPFEIKDGGISKDLLKPYSITILNYVKPIAYKISQQFFKLPIFLALLLFAFYIFKIDFNLNNFILGLIFCVFAYTLHFFLDICISYAAFWMDDVWALSHLKTVCLIVFGGMSFPLDLVNPVFRPIFDFLPFRFFYFVPIQIIQGLLSYRQIILEFLILMTWVLILFLFSKVLLKTGLRKYGAYGN